MVMIRNQLFFIFSFTYGPLVWSSKKHEDFYLSTTQVEYHGVVNVGTEVVLIRQLLGEPQVPSQSLDCSSL